MRSIILLLCVFITVTKSFASERQEQITILAAHWYDVIEPDGTGTYNALFDSIFSESHIVSFDVSTFIRSKRLFTSKKGDILVGVYSKDGNMGLLPKWHIDIEEPVVGLFDKNKSNVNGREDLPNLKVAWFEGYGLDEMLPKPQLIYELKEIEHGEELLKGGRIDILIDYQYNFRQHMLDNYDFIELIPSQKIFVMFQNTAKGKQLAKLFVQKMNELNSNGKLREIYGKYYEPAQFDTLLPSNSGDNNN